MRDRIRAIAAMVVLVLACTRRAPAQAVAPDPVDFTPFSDGRNWIVKQPLVYRIGISHDSVVVPRGFVTDLASIPPALQSIIQQNGPYLLPAVVHDYLYWEQTCTRDQSDQILMLGMLENEVSAFDRVAIYGAVRAAGSYAWDANRKERSQHMLRVIPEDHIQIHAKTIWAAYRAQLMADSVPAGPETVIPAGFCARGSMSTEDALTTP
jgi:hypothetical protein